MVALPQEMLALLQEMLALPEMLALGLWDPYQTLPDPIPPGGSLYPWGSSSQLLKITLPFHLGGLGARIPLPKKQQTPRRPEETLRIS